jgi:hypothetical protein
MMVSGNLESGSRNQELGIRCQESGKQNEVAVNGE